MTAEEQAREWLAKQHLSHTSLERLLAAYGAECERRAGWNERRNWQAQMDAMAMLPKKR